MKRQGLNPVASGALTSGPKSGKSPNLGPLVFGASKPKRAYQYAHGVKVESLSGPRDEDEALR